MEEYSAHRIRPVIKLLGDAAALDETGTTKRHFVVSGLAEMIGADRWMWSYSPKLIPGQNPYLTSMITGGFSESEQTSYLRALEHPLMARMGALLITLFTLMGKPRTRRIAEISFANDFLLKGRSNPWMKARMGPSMASVYPLGEGRYSVIAFYRRCGEEGFEGGQRDLVHLAISELHWLHHEGWNGEEASRLVPRLSDRERLILHHLLNGKSRALIAQQLKISEHTVSGHLKRIFRHFGVSSHPQLMSKFL